MDNEYQLYKAKRAIELSKATGQTFEQSYKNMDELIQLEQKLSISKGER